MAKRPKRTKTDLGDLTPPEEIVKETAKITGKEIEEPKETKIIIKKVGGRPKDPKKSSRTKYTTMADPTIIKQMKIKAIQQDMTTADLLEVLMVEYLKKNK